MVEDLFNRENSNVCVDNYLLISVQKKDFRSNNKEQICIKNEKNKKQKTKQNKNKQTNKQQTNQTNAPPKKNLRPPLPRTDNIINRHI